MNTFNSSEIDHQAYLQISQELMHPSFSVPSKTLANLKGFVYGTYFKIIDKLEFITHQNSRGIIVDDIIDDIRKNLIYSDLAPVQVFAPTHLAKKAQMLDYSRYMLNCVTVALAAAEHNGEETLNTLMRYIGAPATLTDVSNSGHYGDKTKEIMAMVDKNHDLGKPLIDSAGTNDLRQFRELYRRNEDLFTTFKNAQVFYTQYAELQKTLPAVQKRLEEINKATVKLLDLIASQPDKYKIGNVAATRLTNVTYQYAKEVEFIGITLHNGQGFLKATNDTISALRPLLG